MSLFENNLTGKCDVTVKQVYEYLKGLNYEYTIEEVSEAMEDMVRGSINPGLQVAYNIARGVSNKLEILRTENGEVMDSSVPEDEVLIIYNEIKSLKTSDPIKVGDSLMVKDKPYDIHISPSGKSKVIGTFPVGFRFWVKEMKSGWGLTSYGGYIYPKETDFLKMYPQSYDCVPAEFPYTVGTKYVCKEDVDVYMGRSSVFNVLTTLKAGSIIAFTDISDEIATITSTKGVDGYIILNSDEMFEKYVEPVSPLKTTVDGTAEKEVVSIEKNEKVIKSTKTDANVSAEPYKEFFEVSNKKFNIIAGRFRDTLYLENHLNKLHKAGIPATGVSDGSTMICLVGQTNDKDEADAIVKKVKKKGFVVKLIERC